MKLSFSLKKAEGPVDKGRQALNLVVGAAVLVAIGGGAYSYMTGGEASDVQRRLNAKKEERRLKQESLETAQKEAGEALESGLEAVAPFQKGVIDLTQRQGVTLVSFQAGTSPGAFASSLGLSAGEGWQVVPITIELSGEAPKVLEALRSFADIRQPYEFDRVGMARKTVDGKGVATISASITLKLFARQAKPGGSA